MGAYQSTPSLAELTPTDVLITSAEILNLKTTPKVLVTGVAGKIIVPVSIWFETNNPTPFTAYAINIRLLIKHTTSTGNISTEQTTLAATQQSRGILITIASNLLIKGDDLIATVNVGDPTAGTFDIILHIIYRLFATTY